MRASVAASSDRALSKESREGANLCVTDSVPAERRNVQVVDVAQGSRARGTREAARHDSTVST